VRERTLTETLVSEYGFGGTRDEAAAIVYVQ
jgi:hypothetical protein